MNATEALKLAREALTGWMDQPDTPAAYDASMARAVEAVAAIDSLAADADALRLAEEARYRFLLGFLIERGVLTDKRYNNGTWSLQGIYGVDDSGLRGAGRTPEEALDNAMIAVNLDPQAKEKFWRETHAALARPAPAGIKIVADATIPEGEARVMQAGKHVATVTNLAAQPDEAQERAAFEAYMRKRSATTSLARYRTNPATYKTISVHHAWELWQAARASLAPRAQPDHTSLAHEIWSAAKLAPGEGIADGVGRIAALLPVRADEDAARYRCLRDPEFHERHPEIASTDFQSAEELDAAVDAARAQQGDKHE